MSAENIKAVSKLHATYQLRLVSDLRTDALSSPASTFDPRGHLLQQTSRVPTPVPSPLLLASLLAGPIHHRWIHPPGVWSSGGRVGAGSGASLFLAAVCRVFRAEANSLGSPCRLQSAGSCGHPFLLPTGLNPRCGWDVYGLHLFNKSQPI